MGRALRPLPRQRDAAAGSALPGRHSDTILSSFGFTCTYDDWGNQLFDNTFTNNGFFGNPTNGDFGELTLINGKPINCYGGNTDTGGTLTSSPSGLQQSNATCGQTAVAPDPNSSFIAQVNCDAQFFGNVCPPGANYPRRSNVVMHPLPSGLPRACRTRARAWRPTRGAAARCQTMPSAGRCSARFVTVRLSLAKREKFRSLSVKVARGKWRRHKAHGRHARVRVDLGARAARTTSGCDSSSASPVRGHHEFVKFARIYRRC